MIYNYSQDSMKSVNSPVITSFENIYIKSKLIQNAQGMSLIPTKPFTINRLNEIFIYLTF